MGFGTYVSAGLNWLDLYVDNNFLGEKLSQDEFQRVAEEDET